MPKNRKVILVLLGGLFLCVRIIHAQTRFGFDLENLRNQDSFLTKAYDVIKIQNAWEFVKNNAADLFPVVIGIVDTGVANLILLPIALSETIKTF